MATTASSVSSSDPRRQFAVSVVETLRDAGFEALWAGGCVRDQLLGKSPKDYDVASTATPDEVIRIFGTRRTVPVGASFGVVMVLGPTKSAGQIEVATFRSDGEYLDGRRPNSVQFCRPEEDARRRDFTINGLFFDPIRNEVIDYVGGRDDLAAGVVRAIGEPVDRFREDKLRMLRAVRFASTFRFHLDLQTADAIRQFATQLDQVSVERIAQELRRMLAHSTRATAVKMLEETSLLAEVLPEITSISGILQQDETLVALGLLESASFEAALSLLLRPLYVSAEREHRQRVARVEGVCRRLKMSNEETDCVCWLINSLPVLENISAQPLHILKLLLNHPHSQLLLDVSAALARSCGREPVDAEFCRRYLSRSSPEILAPAALIDGRDVMGLGIPAGPVVRELLAIVRNEQLDELLATREQAMDRLRELYRSAR
jgi:poly(A) polymerase